ncbi:MAG: hypothetical protein J2P26_04870 [Nocardiopsaceae bacterium]|nr:hypothetical protein [Nocardiopsaceae bacterium]
MTPGQKDVAKQLVDAFSGDPAQAIRELALEHHVAVAWIDRSIMDVFLRERRGTPLTDEEWARLRPQLEDYDLYVSTLMVDQDTDDTIENVFIRHILRRARVLTTAPDDQKDRDEET